MAAGKINRIELLVHPFFTYHLKGTREAREDAGAFMELWKGCIGQVSKDGNAILIFVSNRLRERDCLKIREGAPVTVRTTKRYWRNMPAARWTAGFFSLRTA